MSTDAELLHCYVKDRSEHAFGELVRRHLGLVYATALRRVGHDAQLAEDVSQKVFTDLARKASSLSGYATLSGWLYLSTQLAAANVVRTERRRKGREGTALIMQTIQSDAEPAPEWEQLRPLLDDLVLELKTDDREAVVLRFFQQQTFAEIGSTLRLTEEAARKRVDRALDKLRAGLARRGVTSSTAMLALALGALSPFSAPASLSTKIACHALAHGSAAGSSLMATLGPSLAIGAALLVGALAVGNQHRANQRLEAELAELKSESGSLAALRAENQQLVRRVSEAEDLRRLTAELPAMRAAIAPAVAKAIVKTPVRATVVVQPSGVMSWGSEPVTLDGFITRLAALQQNAPDGEAKIDIQGLSDFSPLAYVIDQARIANIRHVAVESTATPDPKMGFSWFGR